MDLLGTRKNKPSKPPAAAEADWLDESPVIAEYPPTPSIPAPMSASVSCVSCGCPMFWQDLAGSVHCCDCVAIPASSMVDSTWIATEAVWEPYRPKHWNPLGHLKARDDEEAAKLPDDGF